MSPTPDTLRTFGARFAMTGDVTAAALYDEHDARDVEHGIEVALWVPKPALFATPVARQRLARAIAEVRRVVDPRLRRVFAAGDAPGPWISLQPARPVVLAPTTPPEVIAGWIDAIAGALAALHAAGLVHGGVLEADVVAIDGAIRLGGGGVWGCADTIALANAATAWPLAPERRAGAPASAAADAFALAALIARWLGGPGPDPVAAVQRHHPALAAAIAPSLASEPTRRRADLAELIGAARTAIVAPRTPMGRRRRKKATTEEKTEVGHASGHHASGSHAAQRVPDDNDPTGRVPRDDEPTDRSHQPPAPPATPQSIPEVASAPILAVSMKPGGPGSRLFAQPTPPAPTPNLPRPNLRASTHGDASQSLGHLAPPRDLVERERRRSRRSWMFAALGVVVVAAIVLAVLAAR